MTWLSFINLHVTSCSVYRPLCGVTMEATPRGFPLPSATPLRAHDFLQSGGPQHQNVLTALTMPTTESEPLGVRLALINLGHRDSLNLYSWCLCPGDGWEEKMPGFCSAHRSIPAQASISTWMTGFHSADRACSLQSLRQDKQPRPPINTPTRGVRAFCSVAQWQLHGSSHVFALVTA